jgi:alpha-tubulin suppressor-like RCC1 family protein
MQMHDTGRPPAARHRSRRRALPRVLTAGLAVAVAAVVTPATGTTASAAVPRTPFGTGPAPWGVVPLNIIGWGDNSLGELGNGTTTSTSAPVLADVPPHEIFASVRTVQTSVALTATGRVYGWGNNTFGQIGDGTNEPRLKPVRTSLPSGVKVTAIRESGLFTLALTSTGKVLAWGGNRTGGLGDGTVTDSLTPVRVKIPKGVTIKAISASDHSALALTRSGRVLAWGENAEGQLGDGTTRNRHVPGYVKLPGHTKITSIAAGMQTGYAVTSAGRLLAWGLNSAGQLGDGTTRNRKTPVQVRLPRGVKVTSATAGQLHALALTAGGRVLAWGRNLHGQLGTGSTAGRHVPAWVKLPRGTTVRALAAGREFSVALTAAGRILAWGQDNLGQLGNGSITDRVTRPVRVHLPTGFTPIGIGAGWASDSTLATGRAAM